MKKTRTYHFLCLLAWGMLLAACGKRINENVTLWRKDKIPYGAWYAYNQLDHIFPDAEVVINKVSPDEIDKKVTLDEETYNQTVPAVPDEEAKSLYLVITNRVMPDDKELNALLNMVKAGRHIFISAYDPGKKLLDTLRLSTAFDDLYFDRDSLTLSVYSPVTKEFLPFTYPGKAFDNYFRQLDTSITTILGKDEFGHANFVKFDYEGGGSVYVHLAPIAFSNYFLLHKKNKAYYDNVLSYLPKDIEVIRWDDYYRYYARGDRGDGSGKGFNALGWITAQPGLGVALWLLVLLLLLLYLFESKRKQRVIPVIEPLKNASLDFVKTVGRLYFQRRDNKNLAQKMTVHFLDHVRGKYNIRASLADEGLEQRLAWKSGYDPAAARDLVYFIKYVQDQPKVSEETLLELNGKLEEFYKTTHLSQTTCISKQTT